MDMGKVVEDLSEEDEEFCVVLRKYPKYRGEAHTLVFCFFSFLDGTVIGRPCFGPDSASVAWRPRETLPGAEPTAWWARGPHLHFYLLGLLHLL